MKKDILLPTSLLTWIQAEFTNYSDRLLKELLWRLVSVFCVNLWQQIHHVYFRTRSHCLQLLFHQYKAETVWKSGKRPWILGIPFLSYYVQIAFYTIAQTMLSLLLSKFIKEYNNSQEMYLERVWLLLKDAFDLASRYSMNKVFLIIITVVEGLSNKTLATIGIKLCWTGSLSFQCIQRHNWLICTADPFKLECYGKFNRDQMLKVWGSTLHSGLQSERLL